MDRIETIDKLLTGRKVVTVEESVSALVAARTMTEEHVGAILVVAPDGAPLGIFTERDLMARVVVPGLDPAATPMGDVMTRDMLTVAPNRTIDAVCRYLQERHIRHVPIIDGGKVLGLLSLRDLLRHDLAALTDEVEHLTEYIQGPGEA